MTGKIESALIVFTVLLSIFISQSNAATLFVGPGETYTDIQSAMDDANDGDTVLVQPGTYILSSQITIEKSITVQSVGGVSVTTVNGDNKTRCFYINHLNAVVDGFTIIHGKASGIGDNGEDGDSNNPSGQNGGDGIGYGGGIYIGSNGGSLINCLISNNRASGTGGNGGSGADAICVPKVIFWFCNPAGHGGNGGNGYGYGGGVYIVDNGFIKNCIITNNVSEGHGGSGRDGGCSNYNAADGQMYVGGNGGDGGDGFADGGGVYAENNVSIINSIISENTARAYGEGDVGYACDEYYLAIYGYSGSAYGNGGGVYLSQNGIIQNCTISDNAAFGVGGFDYTWIWPCGDGLCPKYCPCPGVGYGTGGGIYCNSSALIINSIVMNNSAETSDPNYFGGNYSYSCTTPDPGGTENITDDPLFVDADTGDYHLSAGSPCIDTGTAEGAPSIDLEGYPRPLGEGFDRGAYEYALGDTDDDGTPDNEDLCLYDPGKTEPGLCGCGVADTDTDDDGTPDCNDECVNDPDKTEPGVCGCSVADTDIDSDGTPDCNDECVNDPGKIVPGICGCGIADTDTDNDGTPDCNDQCVDDPAKTEPGICGCGVPDTDTDNDGTSDCNDNCPEDPNKVEPGKCGCGVAEGTCDNDDDGGSDEGGGSGGGCFIDTAAISL